MTRWPGKVVLIFAILWSTLSSASANDHVVIAIIIDDIGYSYERGNLALKLPGNITYSVLPHTRHTSYFAAEIARSGREVMLHMPMENLSERKLGPGALMADQAKSEFLGNLRSAFESVPNLRGINNHMGSHLTQQHIPMQWLMEELQARNFYFVDSLTTPNSVARTVARQQQLLAASRDIFLDNDRNRESIDRSFKRLLGIARNHGSAIAIGHPYPETIDYLAGAIPLLDEEGIQLLPVSGVATYQTLNVPMYASHDSQLSKHDKKSSSSDL